MSTKQDFNSLYASEAIKYNALIYKESPLTTTGTLNYTSTSSGQIYNSNSGEVGLLVALQNILNKYIVSLDDFNAKAEISDLTTLSEEFDSHLADYVRQPGYGADSGSANVYAITLNPAPTAYTDGMGIVIKIANANTGASTINVNSLGAKAIKNPDGMALSSGDLTAGGIYSFKYNSTTGNFILVGKGGVKLTGTAQTSDVLPGKTFYNTDPKNILTGAYSNIKSIQRGETTLGGGNYDVSINVPISTINKDNAIITVSVYPSNSTDNASTFLVNPTFIDNSTIKFTRKSGNYGYNTHIAWQVIEFNNVKSKQVGSTTMIMETNVLQTVPVAITSINTSKSILEFTFDLDGSYYRNGDSEVQGSITSATQITFKGNGTEARDHNICWQVIEFN